LIDQAENTLATRNLAKAERLLLVGVFVVAFGLRCGWVLARAHVADGSDVLEYADERDYWSMARALARGETMRDEMGFVAGRMPGYPAFLSLWVGTPRPLLAARLAQAFVAGAGCVAFALIGKHVGGAALGLLCGVLTAIDPFAVLFSNLLLSETVFAAAVGLLVLSTSSLSASADGGARTMAATASLGSCLLRWFGWGICCLVCIYLHPSALLLAGALGLWAVWTWPGRRSAMGLTLGMLVVLAGLAPWAVRNHRLLGETCWLTTRLGISLYDGVGPQATGRSDLAYTREIPEVQGLSELNRDRWFLNRSWEQIRIAPGRILRLAWNKLLLTWNIVPNVEAHRTPAKMLISASWMVPILLLSALGLLRMQALVARKGLLLVPVICLTLLHMVFVGSVRYRVPVMPYVEVLAAGGLLLVARRLRPQLIPRSWLIG
jgi:hypothetical protein